MKLTSGQLKALARESLQGRWGTPIGASVLYMLIAYALILLPSLLLSGNRPIQQILMFVVSCLVTLLLSIFSAGYSYLCLNISRGSVFKLSNLFAAFKMHPDRFIISTFLMLLISTPSTILSYCYLATNEPLFVLGSLVLYLIYFIILLGFSLTTLLLLDDRDLNAIAALKKSWHLMHGNRGRYFYICLSFIGLFLLGMISCGIGYLWIMPYLGVTSVNFYRNVIQEI